jgi:hypothetical protein
MRPSRLLLPPIAAAVLAAQVTPSAIPVRASSEVQPPVSPPLDTRQDAKRQDAPVTLAEADRAIEDLRQVTKELAKVVLSLSAHLDQAIARYDRGYRPADGKQIFGADVDLNDGQADVMHAATRKFMLARMMAARSEEYQPIPLADSDQVEKLIAAARERVEAGDTIMRRLGVVSVKELNSRNSSEWKQRRDQLVKARTAADEAATRALLALPVDLSEIESLDKTSAFDLVVKGFPGQQNQPKKASQDEPQKKPEPTAALVFVHGRLHKRITLINAIGYRMALTDPGIEDRPGRRLFYQEEWVQRGASVIRMRWRVGVDTKTGQHILIKRYPPRELHGSLEDLYKRWDGHYLWYLEPPDGSTEPSRQEVESALTQATRSRELVRIAIQGYKVAVREALARADQAHAAQGKAIPDSGLPDELRERLFAIRGNLARAADILELESEVRRALAQSEQSIRELELLAAWSNRVTLEQGSIAGLSEPEWQKLVDRSDGEIDMAQTVRVEARASLPPDLTEPEAKFPALGKNVVVNIRRRPSWKGLGSAVRCMQEVWRMESSIQGAHRVRRIVSFIDVDTKTGHQTVASHAIKYYPAAPDENLEDIFEQYAAEDVPILAQ